MAVSTDEIPTEIWLLVFEYFCPHCGHGNQVPDFTDPEYWNGRSALNALSQTSPWMRDISQPVLYHCFHYWPYQNKMWKFLRTLLSQPQLARNLRVLSLSDAREDRIDYVTRRDIESWNQASIRIGLPTPGWVTQALSGDGPSQYAVFDGEDQESHLHYRDLHSVPFIDWPRPRNLIMKDLHQWQQLLIIGLISGSLTHLAIFSILGPSQYARRNVEVFGSSQHAGIPFRFPNLRVLSTPTFESHRDFYWFFSRAPLLTRIHVGDAIHQEIPMSTSWIPPASFASVTTLLIAAGPFQQGYMLRLCNQILDLQIHLQHNDDIPWERAIEASSQVWDAWPTTVKNQLRRLRLSSEPDHLHPLPHPGVIVFPHLLDFQNLETLEIDRKSLGRCVWQHLDPAMPWQEALRQMPAILPTSLQSLHIHYTHLAGGSTMLLELDALAYAKRTNLPNLAVVQINLDLCPSRYPYGLPDSRWRLPELMETLGVVASMASVGVDLRFGRGSFHERRGMLPPLPGKIGPW